MCDYSLHNVASRPAQIEDRLVTTKFRKSITRGFAAVGDPNVAVCLMPGTEIAFDENVCVRRERRMRTFVRHRHSTKQEDRVSARALPADEHGQPRDPSRCA